MSEGLLKVTLVDFLPTKEEIQKFAIAYKNDSSLLNVDIGEDDEGLLNQYDEYCKEMEIDPEILFTALFVSRIFYEAVKHIDINNLPEPKQGKKIYRILSRYDLGYGHDWTDEFNTDQELIDHYKQIMVSFGIFDGDDTIENLIDQGLFVFKELEDDAS